MSLASHFFIATGEDAERNDGLEGGSAEHLAVFYRVMHTGLAPIFQIITGTECPQFESVAMSEDYSQITFAFPPSFVSALIELEESQIASIVEKWRIDEEAPYNNDKDLRDLLVALIRLARSATESNRNMYLWNSL